MKRSLKIVAALSALAFSALLLASTGVHGQGQGLGLEELKRIQKGFEITPVPIDLKGRNRNLVGLGSYIVNAQAACNDCHTCPSYAPGHNPFQGGDGQINSANFLGGGVPFGPFIVSPNITPDASGKPAGLEFEEYLELIRTGHDPDDPPGQVLQVMPWPIFRNMNDNDIRAIYEYLRSIPHAEPGSCGGPGE
jgi:hypothetical protein